MQVNRALDVGYTDITAPPHPQAFAGLKACKLTSLIMAASYPLRDAIVTYSNPPSHLNSEHTAPVITNL